VLGSLDLIEELRQALGARAAHKPVVHLCQAIADVRLQEKTKADLVLPLHQSLLAALRAYPAKGIYLIGDKHGRPFKAAALSNMINRSARAAGLPAECLPHGLRKALMRRLAEHGASSKELASVSGHKTLAEIERYTAKADRRKLSAAAIAKLTDEKSK